MTNLSFSEEDKTKFVEFLNIVAAKAEFKMNTADIISYFKLLAHMQQNIIPKITANILEVKRVLEAKEQSNQE